MATTKYQLKNDEWKDLGTLPCFVQVMGGRTDHIRYILDTNIPTDITADSHILYPNSDGTLSLNFNTGNIYARAEGPNLVTVVVTRM